MTNSLRDIIGSTPGQESNAKFVSKDLAKNLEGVNKSRNRPGSTGSDPYVDYMPKSKDEQDFVKLHDTEEHDDVYGNTKFPYQGGTKTAKYPRQSKNVYEAKACEDCGKDPCECDHAKMAKPGKGKGMILGGKKKLQEVLTKKTTAGQVISDFIHSKDPKFAGKSKEERKKMALGAYYGMHPEKSKKMEEELAMPMLEGGKKNKKKDMKKNQDQTAQ